MIKTCPICSKEFQCGGLLCWCAETKLTKKQRNTAKLLASSCLCPDCLQNLKNNI